MSMNRPKRIDYIGAIDDYTLAMESYCDYLERMLQVGSLSEDFGERTNSLVQSMINVNEKLQE